MNTFKYLNDFTYFSRDSKSSQKKYIVFSQYRININDSPIYKHIQFSIFSSSSTSIFLFFKSLLLTSPEISFILLLCTLDPPFSF